MGDALIAVAVTNGTMSRTEKPTVVIEKLEPGPRRDDLIAIRDHLIDHYITGWTTSGRRRTTLAILFAAIAMLVVGLSTVF